ncbi:uncharacterized protein G2W53_000364 [Senna tora]|uniref:Uncharacterized protein n=1 Tax=Senna tora TaxID=362788 RepID=A0A834XDS3_9FABA|nr:uncharacterized protein G2W53_000364 [Senna tora]
MSKPALTLRCRSRTPVLSHYSSGPRRRQLNAAFQGSQKLRNDDGEEEQ